MHLIRGHHVSEDTWLDLKKISNDGAYVKALTKTLWTDYELMNKALNPSNCRPRFKDREEVTVVEENKMIIVKGK